ncbi:phage tail protein, partial [Paraburkholderia steynii]
MANNTGLIAGSGVSVCHGVNYQLEGELK